MAKFILAVLLFLSMIEAATIKTQQRSYDANQYIRVTVTEMSGDSQDWIAIYPAGASNVWENVVDWKWTNGILDGNIFFDGLSDAGDYEVRAFFNNSYNVEDSYAFSVEAGAPAGTEVITQKDIFTPAEPIVVTMTNMFGDDKDWVGVYPVGASNDWGNVVAWSWTSGLKNGDLTLNKIVAGDTPVGNYEARAFFRNSYTVEATHTFSVEAGAPAGTEVVTQKDIFTPAEPIVVTMTNMFGDDKDWVGVYPVGASNDWGNVVAWSWTSGLKNGDLTLNKIVAGDTPVGNYEARAFFRNSYTVEATHTFEVKEEEKTLIINEVMADNAHTILDPDFFGFEDWIEIYNGSDASIDLGGYALSDTVDEAQWTIPEGTVIAAKSYMIFWADDKDTSLEAHHTNFKLSAKGETVALFNPGGTLVDSLVFGKQKIDITCVHHNGGVGFTLPSPKLENKTVLNALELSDTPAFSRSAGFYNSAQSVALTSNNGDIYYTTDGSYPTMNSTPYAGAITISETTMLRAMSVEAGKFPSQRTTSTYFINESSTLPVISLTTDDDYLFDDTIGIYTVGTNGAPKVCGAGNANYMQDWERPANIEYFDANKNIAFNQEVSIEMAGTCSLERGEKSFSIKADKMYGEKEISYKIFPDKNIDTFKGIKLRNAGQDWHKAMMRDAMIQKLLKDSSTLDYQAHQPALLFLNGEYWGIYGVREKKNDDYLEANHPGLGKVDILYGPSAKIKEGDNTEYKNLITYLNNNSLISAENYQVVADQVDTDNFIDYIILETFVGNYDWLYNNVRYYKEQKVGAKWKWILDDLDSGFDLNYSDPDEFGLNHNTIGYALSHPTQDPNNSWRNKPAYTILFRRLIENEIFKNKFVDRYNALLDTALAPAEINALIGRMKAPLEPEMARHILRWQGDNPYGYSIGYSGKSNWERYVGYLSDFANDRPDIIRTQLHDMFGQ